MQGYYPEYGGNQAFQDYFGGFSGNQPSGGFPEIQPFGGCPGNQPYGGFSGCPTYGSQDFFPQSFPDFCDPRALSQAPVTGRYCNEELTRIIQECQATCEYLTTHLKGRCDCRSRRNQLIILRDCADICGTNSKFVPRGSEFDKQTVLLCAQICECCAQECARFSDKLSQQCAKVCLCCAKACRAYVGRSC